MNKLCFAVIFRNGRSDESSGKETEEGERE